MGGVLHTASSHHPPSSHIICHIHHTQIYTLSKWFQPGVAVSLAVVSTFPLTEYIVTLGIQAFFSQMALAQEIQLPYLGRIRVSRR